MHLLILFSFFSIFSTAAFASCYSSTPLDKTDANCAIPGADEELKQSTESASNPNTSTSSSIATSIGFWGTVWGICLTIYCFIKWHMMEAPGWGRNAAWFMSGAAMMKTFSCCKSSNSSRRGCCLAQSTPRSESIETRSNKRLMNRRHQSRPPRQRHYSDDDYV